jgi:hypothetical protein
MLCRKAREVPSRQDQERERDDDDDGMEFKSSFFLTKTQSRVGDKYLCPSARSLIFFYRILVLGLAPIIGQNESSPFKKS